MNVSFGKSGNGYLTPKVSLPITDLRDMGVTPEDKKIHYYYDEKTKSIILTKK